MPALAGETAPDLLIPLSRWQREQLPIRSSENLNLHPKRGFQAHESGACCLIGVAWDLLDRLKLAKILGDVTAYLDIVLLVQRVVIE